MSNHDCDASSSSPCKSLAFRSHHFHLHVCAESALEIIYSFKNTDIEHSCAVILLHFFSPRSFIPKLSADCEDIAEDREGFAVTSVSVRFVTGAE